METPRDIPLAEWTDNDFSGGYDVESAGRMPECQRQVLVMRKVPGISVE